MANAADQFDHEPRKLGSRPLPPRRSSIALMEGRPEMPRPETLHHIETPLSDEERALLHDLLYR
ncbi:MAG: hypothetical protein ACRDYZ_02050 [Acidimicrobiales bacterium]